MKNLFLITLVTMLFTTPLLAQKAEVLYFKAQLACCHARACNNLENQVKGIVESNFENGDVVFKSILITDANNAELVQKYNARSQTVVVVPLRKRKAEVVDATDMVRLFSRNRNQEEFEKNFIGEIKKII